MSEIEPQENIIEHRGPFTVHKSTVMHDRFNMRLIHDEVTRPDGTKGDQYRIDFPNEAVLVFPVDKDRRIYLAGEFTYGTNRYSLEAAGGVINKAQGETPEETAVRKVREEIGVEVEKDSLIKIGKYGEITSRVNNISHAFLARVESVGEPTPNAGDDIWRQVMTFDEAMKLVRSGTIYTGVIAAALWTINDILNNPDRSS